MIQAFFKAANFSAAIEKYSEALDIAVSTSYSCCHTLHRTNNCASDRLQPTSAVLHGNRSMSHLKNTPPAADLALADAQKANELEPTWGKGWVRLGEALEASDQLKEAAEAFTKAAGLAEGLVKTGQSHLSDIAVKYPSHYLSCRS